MAKDNFGWLGNFIANLSKKAVDKLPEDELSGSFPPFTGDPNADASMAPPMGMPPAPPVPPPPPPVEEPLVWNNKYLVKTDSTEFMVQLTPSIVSNPALGAGEQPPPSGMPQTNADPMADTTLNPNANSQDLMGWLQQKDKPFSSQEQGTVDPLSRESEGLPIEDVGDEKRLGSNAQIKIASEPPPITPGVDRSNAYYPCAVCANYMAADNKCSQGLDVEKVQAAKSCSWLNSNFKPFEDPRDPDPSKSPQDKDTVKNDVSDLSGNEGMNSGGGHKFAASPKDDIELKKYLKRIWD